jgi:hypothetical protein
MISKQKKNPVTENTFKGGYGTDPFIKISNGKFEQWKQFKKSFEAALKNLFHSSKKIDGISCWEINKRLNHFAVRGIPKEAIKQRKIILSLPEKKSLEWVSPFQKKLIEKTINDLEGFKNLRSSQLYSYSPLYIEKKAFNKISRWIEIEITEL